jgi:hypothetical protein
MVRLYPCSLMDRAEIPFALFGTPRYIAKFGIKHQSINQSINKNIK